MEKRLFLCHGKNNRFLEKLQKMIILINMDMHIKDMMFTCVTTLKKNDILKIVFFNGARLAMYIGNLEPRRLELHIILPSWQSIS